MSNWMDWRAGGPSASRLPSSTPSRRRHAKVLIVLSCVNRGAGALLCPLFRGGVVRVRVVDVDGALEVEASKPEITTWEWREGGAIGVKRGIWISRWQRWGGQIGKPWCRPPLLMDAIERIRRHWKQPLAALYIFLGRSTEIAPLFPDVEVRPHPRSLFARPPPAASSIRDRTVDAEERRTVTATRAAGEAGGDCV